MAILKNPILFLTTLSKKKCVTCGARDNRALIGGVLLFLLFWSGTDTEQLLKMSEGKRKNPVANVQSKLFETVQHLNWKTFFLLAMGLLALLLQLSISNCSILARFAL